jgi:hypothetical protein
MVPNHQAVLSFMCLNPQFPQFISVDPYEKSPQNDHDHQPTPGF